MNIEQCCFVQRFYSNSYPVPVVRFIIYKDPKQNKKVESRSGYEIGFDYTFFKFQPFFKRVQNSSESA